MRPDLRHPAARARPAASPSTPRASTTRGPPGGSTAATSAGCSTGSGSCRSTRSTSSPAPTSCRSSPGSGRTTAPRWSAGCGAAARCSSTGATRPRCSRSSLHPLLRWRMADEPRVERRAQHGQRTHPQLLDQLREAVRERGPVTLGRARAPRRRHQAGQGRARTCGTGARPRGGRVALLGGEVSAVRNPATFEPPLRPPRARPARRRSWPRRPRPTTTP